MLRRVGSKIPEAGGGYVYLREAYGPGVAFMYGWMAFLVMDPGLTAALAVGLASYAGYGSRTLAVGQSKLVAIVTISTMRVNKHSWRKTRRRR